MCFSIAEACSQSICDNRGDQILKALYLGSILRLLAPSHPPGKYCPFRLEGCVPSGTYMKLAESQSIQMVSVRRPVVQRAIYLPPGLHLTVLLWEYVCRACLTEGMMSVSVFIHENVCRRCKFPSRERPNSLASPPMATTPANGWINMISA